jgi:hypothetical protein
MVTKLHHLNVCSNSVPEMSRFYSDILELSPLSERSQQRVTDQGYAGEVSFMTDGTTEKPGGRIAPGGVAIGGLFGCAK